MGPRESISVHWSRPGTSGPARTPASWPPAPPLLSNLAELGVMRSGRWPPCLGHTRACGYACVCAHAAHLCVCVHQRGGVLASTAGGGWHWGRVSGKSCWQAEVEGRRELVGTQDG